MGDLDFLLKTFQVLSQAKKQGTWSMKHRLVIVGLILFIVSFVGFMVSLLSKKSNLIPVFFVSFLIGSLTFFVSSILVRISAKSESHGNSAEEAGMIGEQNTAHQLAFLSDDYKVFNNITIHHHHKHQQIDHLVIGPNGIFHIETKTLSGNLTFSANGFTKNGQPYEDPTGQVYRHQFIIEAILKEAGISGDVVGVICFSHPNCVLNGSSPQFLTCRLDRLIHSIVTYQPKHRLDSASVETIANTLKKSMGQAFTQ